MCGSKERNRRVVHRLPVNTRHACEALRGALCVPTRRRRQPVSVDRRVTKCANAARPFIVGAAELLR